MAVWDRVSRLRGLSGIQPTMLSALSEDTVRKLSEKGFVMRLSAGQLLTEKGIAQQEMFVILDGAFEAYDGDRRLRVMGSGDVIGEVAFFGSSARRSASVRAASDGQVLVLRRRFMDELITSDPACGAEILFSSPACWPIASTATARQLTDARARASMLSVCMPSGARPLTRCASAASTSRR